MPSGGLMQLVAYGAQDRYLTGDPEVTFFRTTYEPFAHFSAANFESVGQEIGVNTIGQSLRHTTYNESIEKHHSNHHSNHQHEIIKYKDFKTFDPYDQKQCVICLEEFKAKDDLILRKCQHVYHKKCHSGHNGNSGHSTQMKKCPICRS